jgi:hypothetical protein
MLRVAQRRRTSEMIEAFPSKYPLGSFDIERKRAIGRSGTADIDTFPAFGVHVEGFQRRSPAASLAAAAT